MSSLAVRPAARPLRGSVTLPSDKSISHRALILAALADGTSKVGGFSYGEDNLATLRAFGQMGVASQDDLAGTLQVKGVGLGGLHAPLQAIDCGNSGTTMRLLTGLLAAQPFQSRLVGDASLSRRPMGRVVEPLRARGATIRGTAHPSREGVVTAPLDIGPLADDERLGAFEYELPVASAQVKSALLLSGLFATGPTVLTEPCASRDHTERMLRALGVRVETNELTVSLEPPAGDRSLRSFELTLPGDLSAAAFAVVAAQLVEDSEVVTLGVGLNPTRTGILDVIRQFGGELGVTPKLDALGEPVGDVASRGSSLRASRVGGVLAVRAIDEIPVAAVLAARAAGTSEFVDVGELRVKESDRIARTVELLHAFGVDAEEAPAGFAVHGRPEGRLRAARVSSGGDHRIAMCAAVLGLMADGESVIEDTDCVATSFPGFATTLQALGAEVTAR